MASPSRAERFAARIDELPPSIRPAVYGAGVIVMLMLMRGAWIVAPLAVIYVFATQPHPWHVLGVGASVVALAMLGGALSGLAYGLVGRHVRGILPGGRYLTGILTVFPYMLLVTYIVGFTEGRTLWRAPGTLDWIIAGLTSLLFGSVIGHSWFAPDEEGRHGDEEAPS